jgi:hypothetical protein
LASYGADQTDLFRRSARYVMANALGIKVSPEPLTAADEVME